jgi:hypothetical protein
MNTKPDTRGACSGDPLQTCRCGQQFRNHYGKTFKICLDCRMELGERARRPHGRGAAEHMSQPIGARFAAGYSLVDTAEELGI